MVDDGRGIIILVEAAGESALLGVQGRDGIGVVGSPPTYTAWEGSRRDTTLEEHGPPWKDTNLED